MKKSIVSILVLLIVLSLCVACTDGGKLSDDPTPSLSPEEEMADDAQPPSIMINGQVYYCFGADGGLVPTEDQICGTIKSMCKEASHTNEIPSENEQANFPAALDQPYAIKDGKVYLFWSNEWHICTPAGEEVWNSEICYPLVMLDGSLYYCFQDKADIALADDDISGTVKSICGGGLHGRFSQDEQANFTAALNQPYAVIGSNVYLYLDGEWEVCHPAPANETGGLKAD